MWISAGTFHPRLLYWGCGGIVALFSSNKAIFLVRTAIQDEARGGEPRCLLRGPACYTPVALSRMRNEPTLARKLVAGTGLILSFALIFALTRSQPKGPPPLAFAREDAAPTGSGTIRKQQPITGSGVTARDILGLDAGPAPEGSELLSDLLYGSLPQTPPPSTASYSLGLAEILYGLEAPDENVLSFGDAPTSDVLVGPYPAPLSRTFYYSGDTIRVFSGYPRSVMEIYWMDDPDTAPEPSNVFAAEVGDDGTIALPAVSLPLGTFIFANTLPEAQCGGRYLSDCRMQKEYLGEFAVLVGSGSTIPGAPAFDPSLTALPTPPAS